MYRSLSTYIEKGTNNNREMIVHNILVFFYLNQLITVIISVRIRLTKLMIVEEYNKQASCTSPNFFFLMLDEPHKKRRVKLRRMIFFLVEVRSDRVVALFELFDASTKKSQ